MTEAFQKEPSLLLSFVNKLAKFSESRNIEISPSCHLVTKHLVNHFRRTFQKNCCDAQSHAFIKKAFPFSSLKIIQPDELDNFLVTESVRNKAFYKSIGRNDTQVS